MSTGMRRFLFWSPRALCIVFAAFLSIFAFDVFGAGYGFGETVVSLLMHLIPVYVVVLALVLAWRWEWTGAIVFPASGLVYLVSMWGRVHWSAYLAISGPLFLVGALFLASWRYSAELRAR